MVGSVGREKTAVGQKESVKSRGKYWDGRDKIDWYMGTVSERKCSEMIGQAAADRTKCWVIRPLNMNPGLEDGSVAERIREKSCQCRSEHFKIEEGGFWQTMCHCSGGEMCVKGRSVHLLKTAACLSDSVPDFGTECRTEEKRVTFTGGKLPLYLRNCKECSEGENSSGAERVKSHGQYWVGRDKIDCNLLEGTKYKGIEMRRNMSGGKAPLAYNVSGQWQGSGDLYIIPRNLNGSVQNCWEGNRTRPDKLKRDWVLKNLHLCQKEVCTLFERMRHLARKCTELLWKKQKLPSIVVKARQESTLQYKNSALFFWENGTGYLKFLESCGEKAAHVLTKQLHRCFDTAGRRSTHSTKMMRSGLRKAAGRHAKRTKRHLSAVKSSIVVGGLAGWVVNGTKIVHICLNLAPKSGLYFGLVGGHMAQMTWGVTDSVHRCFKENDTGWEKNETNSQDTEEEQVPPETFVNLVEKLSIISVCMI
ncbi:hypothetical protein T4C_7959 [Trichinella pseudospiralis]|uniref:Uncharacterized protein n=1 Tax=Trichinella pseudospiralis TaxID=6337 RepID=A0A0V1ISB8_TRIPS|nr:hypothetical protein T4C_7959 [Trichinella pseudospiralis]